MSLVLAVCPWSEVSEVNFVRLSEENYCEHYGPLTEKNMVNVKIK